MKEALATKSNRIFTVIGFGCSSPVHNLPYNIGARYVFSFVITTVSSHLHLWPINVDLDVYLVFNLFL
jgi:hypothetical protein